MQSETTYKFTNECRRVFSVMKESVLQQYPSSVVIPEHFLIAVSEVKDCMAYKVLTNLLTSDSLSELLEWWIEFVNSVSAGNPSLSVKYDKVFDKSLKECSENGETISSCTFLSALMRNESRLGSKMAYFGVTEKQIQREMSEIPSEEDESKRNGRKKKNKPQHVTQTEKKKVPVQEKPQIENNEVEKNLLNLNVLAAQGLVEPVIGNNLLIDKMLTVLLKKNRNNVLLVGDVGTGKTSTVHHIANLINNCMVNKNFVNRQLMKMNFMSLTAGTTFRGGFEMKYDAIVNAARKNGNYIFFIDDLHSILGQNSKFSEVSTDVMLDIILSDKRIPCICTSTYEGYSKYIRSNEILSERFEVIYMPKLTKEETINAVMAMRAIYEKHHGVVITEDVITECINMCDRYMSSMSVGSVCDVIDLASSIQRMNEPSDEILENLRIELMDIDIEIEDVNSSNDTTKYTKYDELVRKRIEKKSQIALREKELSLKRLTEPLEMENIITALSQKTGTAVGELGKDDKERLKNIATELKKLVIGQDEAVDKLCSAIRRKRAGISDNKKPSVFMFVGKTGTGKTYLAKKLAEKLYGSENDMVRLDMSEYADKTSVNKLTGASSGYVGYDDGGVLTEAVKKNRHCVLLLDEIEKADDEVFNVFLQVFDDGRMTDNKGALVDFSDTVIIMTSNVGMKEIEDKGICVGFNRNNGDILDKSVVLKSIKKRFKPEFINRIGDIIFFNTLTDDNLKQIIQMEIGNVGKRVEKNGYKLSNEIINGRLLEDIFNSVTEERDYGARPVLREIQRQLEDKLADCIINGNIQPGYVFTENDIYDTKEN